MIDLSNDRVESNSTVLPQQQQQQRPPQPPGEGGAGIGQRPAAASRARLLRCDSAGYNHIYRRSRSRSRSQ